MTEIEILKDEVARLQLAMKAMTDRMDNMDRQLGNVEFRTRGSILIGPTPEKWPTTPDISMFKWVNGVPK